MQKSSQRGVAKKEHESVITNHARISWDDIRIFLACANSSSFRMAANKLNLSSSTVSRRINRLEHALGVSLFNRLTDGAILTHEAKEIKNSALNMERTIYDVVNKGMQADVSARGMVTLSITEGLGSYWVVPKLVELQQNYPFIMLNLQCAMECADVLRLEADISVQFKRPTNPDLMVTKLGRLHIYPFAAKKYLDTYGYPKSREDMRNHRIIQQIASQLDESIWAEKLGLESIADLVGMVTNSSTSLFYAVEQGAGIGVLPTFATALGAPITPIDLNDYHSMDIWLTYHPGIKKVPRKAIVIDWLRSIFDPKIYPWFRDEFIHPNELVKIIPSEAKMNNGRGFASVSPSGR